MATFLFLVVFSMLFINGCVLGFDEDDEDETEFATVSIKI